MIGGADHAFALHPLDQGGGAVVANLQAALNGDFDKAWEIYWSLQPMRDLWWSVHAHPFHMGIHPFSHWKYWEGLVGMTGGPLRQVTPLVHHDVRDQSKALWRHYGILRGDVAYQDAVIR